MIINQLLEEKIGLRNENSESKHILSLRYMILYNFCCKTQIISQADETSTGQTGATSTQEVTHASSSSPKLLHDWTKLQAPWNTCMLQILLLQSFFMIQQDWISTRVYTRSMVHMSCKTSSWLNKIAKFSPKFGWTLFLQMFICRLYSYKLAETNVIESIFLKWNPNEMRPYTWMVLLLQSFWTQ